MWRLARTMLALGLGMAVAIAPVVGIMVHQKNLGKQKTAPWR